MPRHHYRCSSCKGLFAEDVVGELTSWPTDCPNCLTATLVPELPINIRKNEVATVMQPRILPLTVLTLTPIVIGPITYPAAFAVLVGESWSPAASDKLKRPGLVVSSAILHPDKTTRHCAGFQLQRPGKPPKKVARLAIRGADAIDIPQCFIEVAPDQSLDNLYDCPYRSNRSTGNYFRTGLAANEYDQQFREIVRDKAYELYRAPKAGSPLELYASAVGLPGWMASESAIPAAPPPSGVFATGLPTKVKEADRVYENRELTEIWLTLDNEKSNGEIVAHDVLLITVAPVIFSCELEKPERIFVVHVPPGGSLPPNFGVVADILGHAGSIPVTLLDGKKSKGDVWTQDAVHFGYCESQTTIYPAVVLTTRRNKAVAEKPGLEKIPNQFQTDTKTALWSEMSELDKSHTMDYGGNLVVSPPVLEATEKVAFSEGGDQIPAHPAAPYGKLLLGDDGESSNDSPSDRVGKWLRGQRVQPVVPLATGWLNVKHVDEILGLCRAPKSCEVTGCGANGFVFLFADPELFVTLWSRAKKANAVHGARSLKSLEGYTLTKGAPDPDVHPWMSILAAIRERMTAALALADGDFLDVPVLYTPGATKAKSRAPNLVNGVFLDKVVLLPKPFGPRVAFQDIGAVLTGVGGITKELVEAASLGSYTRESIWDTPVSEQKPKTCFGKGTITKEKVLATPGDMVKELEVPEEFALWEFEVSRIDVFEAYMRVRMGALGLTVHFVDDYPDYYEGGGDLHCGTKVRRVLPDIKSGTRWHRIWSKLIEVQ